MMKYAWRILSLVLILSLLMGAALAETGTEIEIDWDARYTYAELEGQLEAIAAAYPEIAQLYPIGTSFQERKLWCMELTNPEVPEEDKTGIAVLANIHGGERESAASAMYFAWWMATESASEQVQEILNSYTVYVVPVINPDGYEQSFVYNTRQNLRPRDLNGDGTPFSDPYADIDGDGYIATLYRGTADAQPDRKTHSAFGMESPDWDRNGIPGDDPCNSGVDLNRSFDVPWDCADLETAQAEGKEADGRSGATAIEPEVQAVQNFLCDKQIDALATLHSGLQCVLYPWCHRAYDESLDSGEIPFMKEVAENMAAALQETTGRGFYAKSSYDDYPTRGELIDFAYGQMNAHAYTIEVYNGGKSVDGAVSACKWEDALPEEKWVFYDAEQLAGLGLDVTSLMDGAGEGLKEGEGLWFYTGAAAQMVDRAPEDQGTMVQGCRDALLVMIDSELQGVG